MKIGILGGIHEDITRLREALEVLDRKGCAELVCLGDIVGYSTPFYGYPDARDAHACIALVRERCRHVVAGNHDLFAARRLPEHTTFRYPPDWYELPPARQAATSQDAVWLYEDEATTDLGSEDIAYLRSLPEYVVAEYEGTKLLLSHYAYPNLVGDGVAFDPSENGGIRHHFEFMAERGCYLAVFSHDLGTGVRIFTEGGLEELPFGSHRLPEGTVALNGSWVANGTDPNGVLVLDLAARTVDAIPLNTPPHVSSR